MVMHELIAEVQSRGVEVKEGQVNYAVIRGYISPVEQDAIGTRHFEAHHVDEVIAYLSSPRKRGRRRVACVLLDAASAGKKVQGQS
jgi:hypothetical protein